MDYPHQPVLVHEVSRVLITLAEGVYVDGTAGSGGHSAELAGRLKGPGRLICLDRDPEAVAASRRRLAAHGERVDVRHGNYAHLDSILGELGVRQVQGILLDLGMSSGQLEESGRGFSFMRDEPLDMRMDPDNGTTAKDLVNRLSQAELERLLRIYGEEKRARGIARAVVTARKKGPIETSCQLAAIVQAAAPHRSKARHPATRSFQALRIATNRELEHLAGFLAKAPALIGQGGRLVVIAYHSLEDRMVKRAMQDWESGCSCAPGLPVCGCGKVPRFRRPFKRSVCPGPEEIQRNPRARSARMRVAERLGP